MGDHSVRSVEVARTVGCLTFACSLVVTLVVLAATLVALLVATDQRDGGYCESIDHPSSCTSEGLVALVGFGATGVGVWGAAAGVGLLRGRSGARRAVVITSSVWAIVSAALVVALAPTPDALGVGGMLIGMAIVGCFATIAVLAARLPLPTVSPLAGGRPGRGRRRSRPG
jgi:hypothetical protein